MDCLAALTVEAVQDPTTAVQAYWLGLVCAMGPAPVTCGGLIERAQGDPGLPDWARPRAPRALVQLLRAGVLLLAEPAAALPPAAAGTWPDLTASCAGAMLRLPQVSQSYAADFCEEVQRLWQAVCRLYGPRPPAWAACPEEILRGAVLFDAGLYFACHEYFETLWGRTEDAASDLFQGLIQVAVAMRHLESHNLRGAVRLLRTGMARLQRYPASYRGLDLESFRARLTGLLEYLHTFPAAYQFEAARVPHLLDHARE